MRIEWQTVSVAEVIGFFVKANLKAGEDWSNYSEIEYWVDAQKKEVSIKLSIKEPNDKALGKDSSLKT